MDMLLLGLYFDDTIDEPLTLKIVQTALHA